MAKLATTVGQLLVNEALPEDMRDYNRVFDKKGLSDLLAEVAEKHPDKYRDISFQLGQIGYEAAYNTGGNSFGLSAMKKAKVARDRRKVIQQQIDEILDDDYLDDDTRDKLLIRAVGDVMSKERDEILDESLADNNQLALQLKGAGRGNKMNLSSLRGSDGLYQDHRDRIIPIPVLKSYSQGLSPAEYWAGTYGARQGVMAVKFATRDAGFLSKQLNQIAHRHVITDIDRDGEPDTLIGYPTDVEDDDNEGALLATDTAGYKRNTILTPKILADLRRRKIKRLLVRSPIVSGSPDGGIYARDAGVREFGGLPVRGENVGLAAAQALSEPISQSQLSAKHTGGVAGESKGVSGFERINQLIQVPKAFKGGAAHATIDGKVQSIADAPAGGKYVVIDNKQHYIGAGYNPSIKPGDVVEAGDVISEGMPNPSLITKYKGVGEGRRYFVKAFIDAIRDAGMNAHRRNVELLARGLINHVRLTDEIGDFGPDDVVPYSALEHSYKPREEARITHPRGAVGSYLERPYLHYSIGTRVTPSMLKDFDEFGVNQINVHKDPPPFEPEMVRGMANLHHDPDWMTRMFGSGLKGSVLKSVHTGGTSDEQGTSFVPGRARAVDFGRSGGPVQNPKRNLGYSSKPASPVTPKTVLKITPESAGRHVRKLLD